MSRQSSLRASDADRDAIAERLHRAAVEGRIEPDELEQRLHLALRARTYGELGRLVADLPGRRERRPRAVPVALAVALRLVVLVAVIAAVLVVAAVTAAWWIVWALLWLTVRTRRPRRRMGRPVSPRLRGI
jgi:Flp pilus assembly protein TadB